MNSHSSRIPAVVACLLDFYLSRGRLQRCRLFLLIGSVIGIVWLTSLSLTYISHWSSPSFSIWLAISTTVTSGMFLLSSTRKSLLFSLKGLPISSIVPVGNFTSHAKAICACFFACGVANSLPVSSQLSTKQTCHLGTSYQPAVGFFVRPIAAPSPFTEALFCS